MTRICRATALAVVFAVVTSGSLLAQHGASTGGLARLAQEQKLANNWRRVLMIGAHPDDEDTQLLTVLARGQGIHTAYLSLTRGDGGQNLIGPELGEALGVLRTEELASARALDGGVQFYTRAFDFGFSKTAEETLRFWGHDSVLKDMVRIIRRFRPQVVISVWSGTPADGHGNHIASGLLTPEAFHAAGDPKRFPELEREGLEPWQPSKLYLTARGGGNATISFDAGAIDPAVGMSYRQIAVRSRSQHRSQNQGGLEELGPARSAVRLVERVPGVTGPDDSLFSGVRPEPIQASEPHAVEARLIERGIVLDATTDDDEVVPGQLLPVTLRAYNSGRDTAYVLFGMVPHVDFTSRGDRCPSKPAAVAPGALFSCEYQTTVWPTAGPTTPYYLTRPRPQLLPGIPGALYDWTDADPSVRGEPSELPLEARFTIGRSPTADSAFTARREVVGRFRDPVIGEVRRPIEIVPRVALDLEPNHLLWAEGRRTHEFRVNMEHLARDSTSGMVSLLLPPGWTSSGAQPVHFTNEGERAVARFVITAPLHVKDGTFVFTAQLVTGKDTIETGLYRIRYPHTRDRNIATSAQAVSVVADVKFPAFTPIGYIRGGGDLVPEQLINAGMHVDLLTGDALERGSLAGYKVIVVGPRAYEADPSVIRAHPRLMQWLQGGGTLVIEYQQIPYTTGGYAPKPMTIVAPTQSRVTDETAPVTFVAPLHQVLRWPNLIGPKDFDGWVQERGLDFPPQWDAAWTPILEMHDPGDTPREGGLLVAHVGKGVAVYTGLSFHRELPALVPGAWRLFANILALGQQPAVAKKP